MSSTALPHPIALVGHGAIARWLTARLEGTVHIVGRGDPVPAVPLVVEAAGHAAVAEHGPAALAAGSDLLLASVGALADTVLHRRITEAVARPGAGRLILPAGALAGVDALAAARLGGLDEVVYTARKPAATLLPDRTLAVETVVLDGTAREAALAFPKSSNVAATVALAGLGFEATRVRIVADPAAEANIHTIAARGTFGQFETSIAGLPLPDNPRSSMLTAMSLLRAILNRHARIVI
ncbi:MAG: aspartate dehydrogenase [Alkalilacustris sp.]